MSGASAVVTGRDVRDEDGHVQELGFTHTWHWRAGAWRLVASHESAAR